MSSAASSLSSASSPASASAQSSFKINGKDLTFAVTDSGRYELPVLSTVDKLGRRTFWKTYVSPDHLIHSESWIDGGKVKQFAPVAVEPKNVGKKNETTQLQQALLECHSKWTKKHDHAYVEEQRNPLVVDHSPEVYLPMLAQKYEERGQKYLRVPFGASRKFDGVRCIAHRQTSAAREVLLTSRLGKPFSNLQRIREHCSLLLPRDPLVLLDGELYSHSVPFNAISGCVRSKAPSSYDSQMEFYIFDRVRSDHPEEPYSSRIEALHQLEEQYHRLIPNPLDRVIKFEGFEVVSRHDDVKCFHDRYVAEGYEGVILRNLDGPYLFKNRSNDVQKYKTFEDREFRITGFKEGNGSDAGCIILECGTERGETFDVRPRGSLEWRRGMFLRGAELVGKQLTVRYQKTGLEDGSLPRFPVGIDIRDYE